MRLRFRTNAPRRPPKILLVGPPGSGKTSIGRVLAQRYGLVFVSIGNLINGEIGNKTKVGRMAADLMKEGELLPDDIIISLLESRLNQSDCKVNGWILEGFPKTEAQINLLKGMKQIPSLIVALQLDDDVVYERHEYKKTDPVTGIVYNMKASPPTDGEIVSRLLTRECDRLEIVKKRLKAWKEFLPKIEESYKDKRVTLNADKPIVTLAETISESIENPPQ